MGGKMNLYGIDPFKLKVVEAEVTSESEYWFELEHAPGSSGGLSPSVRKGYEHRTPESAIEDYYKNRVRHLKRAIKEHATIFALMQAYGLKPKF